MDEIKMSILNKIPSMQVDDLNKLRKNALLKFDDPKSHQLACDVLDAIDKELERRYIPGMIKTFLETFPDGFYDQKQAIQERDYKLQASQLFQTILGKDVYLDILKQNEFSEIIKRISQSVNSTNFIQGSFEKPILLDAIKKNPERYCTALYNFIYGDGTEKDRIDSFIKVLDDLSLLKWTYFSYFLFLSDTEKYIFVKPEMLKRSLEICRYPLNYESKPSYELYTEILKFSHWLKDKITELSPRDMIDVHSFMWHMAPTGKFSE